MDRLISCEFNMDTACVEMKFADGSMIAIDTIAVENKVADNMYQRSELDYLIYNKPLGICRPYSKWRSGNVFENCNFIRNTRKLVNKQTRVSQNHQPR